MGFWKTLGKIGSIAAPIVAAPFTGGASLALIGAGAGAAHGALSGGGWKGAALGGGLGAIPGLSGAGLAKGAVAPGLKAGLGQAAKSGISQLAGVGGNMAAGGGIGGFLGKYGPLIGQVGGMVAGGIAGKKSEQNAMKRSPEEQFALGGAQGLAGQAGATAGNLINQSQGWMSGPANYYQTLLSGNRAAMNQAVAPGVAAITDVYRGAERNLSKMGIQGARRDTAAGELNRQRASQIAGLTTGVQPYAAEQLAQLGTNTLTAGAGLTGTAGNIYGNLLTQGSANRQYGRKEGADTARGIGGFIADIGKTVGGMYGNKQGGPTGSRAPATQSNPFQYKTPFQIPGYGSGGGAATPPIVGATSPRPWANVQFGQATGQGGPVAGNSPDWMQGTVRSQVMPRRSGGLYDY